MATKKRTILVVDDTPANIGLLGQVLGAEYEILFATNGYDALNIALTEKVDLILLDVMMPGMDGFETCSRLKADPATSDIPVIFISALSQDLDETRGLDLGAIDYITKPIRPAILTARVRNHLELKRHRDILKELSFLDGLTGIPNRRRFDEALDMEWRRALRAGIPLSLIMMDIDFFKQFNDSYGHIAGDDCLRQVATAISKVSQRPGDLVARYGGEEFVALLPATDANGALFIAEKIQHVIKELAIPHASSAVSPAVTLSIGVVTSIPQLQNKATNLLEAADQNLYEAKRSGRNRIVNSNIDVFADRK